MDDVNLRTILGLGLTVFVIFGGGPLLASNETGAILPPPPQPEVREADSHQQLPNAPQKATSWKSVRNESKNTARRLNLQNLVVTPIEGYETSSAACAFYSRLGTSLMFYDSNGKYFLPQSSCGVEDDEMILTTRVVTNFSAGKYTLSKQCLNPDVAWRAELLANYLSTGQVNITLKAVKGNCQYQDDEPYAYEVRIL